MALSNSPYCLTQQEQLRRERFARERRLREEETNASLERANDVAAMHAKLAQAPTQAATPVGMPLQLLGAPGMLAVPHSMPGVMVPDQGPRYNDPRNGYLTDIYGKEQSYRPFGDEEFRVRGKLPTRAALWDAETWWATATPKDAGKPLTAGQREYGFTPVAASDWGAASLDADATGLLAGARLNAGNEWDGNGNGEYQVYTKDNVKINPTSGAVTLTSRLVPDDDPQRVWHRTRDKINWGHDNPAHNEGHKQLWQFSSGKAVHTNGGNGFGMGTLTFTVDNPYKLPWGSWPCIWLLGRGPWPMNGEIDIMEMLPLELPFRQMSSAIHWGPIEGEDARQFEKGETRARKWGDRIEFKVTRSRTRITVHMRDEGTRKWYMLNDVDLEKFGKHEEDISASVSGPMDLIANIAVGGAKLKRNILGTEVKSEPKWFRPGWNDDQASWTIDKFGWIPEGEYPQRPTYYDFDDDGVPELERDEL